MRVAHSPSLDANAPKGFFGFFLIRISDSEFAALRSAMDFLPLPISKRNLLKTAWGRGLGLWGTAEACETRPRRLPAPGAGAGHQADPFSIRPYMRSPENRIRGF